MDTAALILFTDARGFTTWANSPEVFARLGDFAGKFSGVVRKVFPKRQYFHKGLGDGAMIVRPLSGELTAETAADLLQGTLQLIRRANEEFTRVCTGFAQSIGHRTNLNLGWALCAGPCKRSHHPKTT